MLQKDSAEKAVRDIRRNTRRSLDALETTQYLGYITQILGDFKKGDLGAPSAVR